VWVWLGETGTGKMRSSQSEELRMSDALDVVNTDLQKMKTELAEREVQL
jgi:hypothetical protein